MLRSYTKVGMLVLVASVACNKKSEDEAKPEGKIAALEGADTKVEVAKSLKATLSAIIPRLGGNLVALGDYGLELAIHESGLVEGLLFDAQGKPIEKPEATDLAVKLHTKDGAQPVAKLQWDAGSKRYVGNATAAAKEGADAKADSKVDAKADVKTDAKAEAVNTADAKAALKAETAPKAEAKVAADAKADTKADVDASATADAAVLAQLELETKPVQVEAKLGGKAESATLTEYAVLPAPEFGGTVLGAGKYKTELIGRPDGHVQAFVTDASGAKLDAGANAKLKARVGADAKQVVELKWDPAHACFMGKLDAGAKFDGQPLSVTLDAGGKSQVGGLAKLPVSVDVDPEAAVVVAGDFPVELTTKAGFVEARVFDASGKAQAAGDLDVKLLANADAKAAAKANVEAKAKATPELSLKWHAPCACYRAKLAAKLDLFAAPIKLRLLNNGRWHAGAAASLKMAQNAQLHGDARLAADAKLGGDAKLDAKLPKPTAKLNADAKAKLDAAANAKANAAAAAKAKGQALAKLKGDAKANVSVPKPKVEVKKSASANASTDNKGTAKAGVKAGFSLGTK